jgi:Predicted nucleotidyltransferases
VIEEIRTLACKYHVEKMILFGARARGDFKRTSDIDLAVEGGEFTRFALDIEEEKGAL